MDVSNIPSSVSGDVKLYSNGLSKIKLINMNIYITSYFWQYIIIIFSQVI